MKFEGKALPMKTMIAVESLKKKSRNKYIVTTDVDTVTLSEDTIVTHRILKGSTFTEDEWEAIKEGKTKANAWDRVLNYLSFQARSEKEIITYLENLKIEESAIAEIIERLKSLDLVNDERMASSLVSSYKNSNKGPYLIREKLTQKGIDESIINQALRSYTSAEEETNIQNVIKKEQRLRNSYPVFKQKKMIYEKLLRDGFSMELVTKVIEETTFTSNHSSRLKQDFQKTIQRETDKNKIIARLIQKGYSYPEIKKFLEEREN